MPRYHVFGEDYEGDTCLFKTDYPHIIEEFISHSPTAEFYSIEDRAIRVFDKQNNSYSTRRVNAIPPNPQNDAG